MDELKPVGRIKGRFLPWYLATFATLTQLERPFNIVAQIILWYPFAGFLWIPIWFLLAESQIVAKESEGKTTKGMGNQQDATSPAILTQVQEALKKADWAKIGKIAFAVAGLVFVGFMAVVSTVLSSRMPCEYCGGQMNIQRQVCSRCGRRK